MTKITTKDGTKVEVGANIVPVGSLRLITDATRGSVKIVMLSGDFVANGRYDQYTNNSNQPFTSFANLITYLKTNLF